MEFETRPQPKLRLPTFVVCCVIVVIIVTIVPSAAQKSNGDAVRGHRLAKAWCSACHQIDENSWGVFDGPSFLDIARRPSTTPLSLNVFFRTSHENMPNFHVSGREAKDLIAYILSLQKHLWKSQ
jgi:cytochrome c